MKKHHSRKKRNTDLSAGFPLRFGIGSDSRYDTLILGLVNAAPYFACVAFACWLTVRDLLASLNRCGS